ncbi:MAG: hypothetical protein KAI17_03445 [Thiotrichaceae bacterium]|nr:hypothetical protein [Thiotrichaceae bacterium]
MKNKGEWIRGLCTIGATVIIVISGGFSVLFIEKTDYTHIEKALNRLTMQVTGHDKTLCRHFSDHPQPHMPHALYPA